MKSWLLLTQERGSASSASPKIEEWENGHFAVADASAHVGDLVLLWRRGRGGGAVALGRIVETAVIGPPASLRSMIRGQPDGEETTQTDGVRAARCRVRVDFDRPFPASPLSAGSWGVPMLGQIVRAAGRDLTAISLTDAQWEALNRWIERPQPPADWLSAWNIPPGSVVSRTQLHDVYGGNSRVVAGPSAKTRNVFLFLNRDPAVAELTPRLSGDVLLAPGQVQLGDRLSMENLGALSHLRRGLPLRVFEVRRGECFYLGEFAVVEDLPVARWIEVGEPKVRNFGDMEFVQVRQAPILRLRQLNGIRPFADGSDSFDEAPRISLSLRLASTDDECDVTPGRSGSEPPVEVVPAEAICEASGSTGADTVRRLLSLLEHDPEAAQAIGEIDEAQAFATLVQHARRRTDLAELRVVAENPDSTESDLQKCLERMTWVFGAEFLSGSARRDLTAQDQLDLSLIRPDGSLHGVEIKKAKISSLIKKHRNHLTVGADINDATGQALNYLRSLDEHRHQILADFNIDCRRATMTVVIGHASFVTGKITAEQVAETIRTYNSNMARITVVTYDQLIEAAQRSLDLAGPSAVDR
ncbi:Shedu anti-phage system protein SduA domain-containing protein [Streptomyces sp. CBMA156]|uniref:Shedu anti-phage system protein SduA domain-containing protein n=1 Tax=Streptomyces sp. CBMA156 TaxID=1930280 RepID=UPI001661C7B8|nr:Shedu anti-phage system protein SduA domain-containing protein [Streptomyces sp. CBMA156]